MSKQPTQGTERAMQEAATWKIRLNEAPHDETVQAECAAWRALDPDHERAWRRMERAWTATGQLAPGMLPHDRPATSQQPAPSRTYAPWRRPLWVAAGCMVPLAASLLAFATPDLMVRLQADYYTKTGETRTVSLSDGTAMTLAGHSAVAVHYKGQERGVTLLAGEAFFNVVHDGKRGFAVRAGNVTTRDIGTAFDVQMAGPHVHVAVREGAVSVAHRSAPALRLTAGQQWTVDQRTGQARRGTIDPEDVGSWRSGQIVLNDVRFSEAIEVLGRYYPGTIVTHGLEHDTIPVGGVYDLHHPREALEALCALHGSRLVPLPAGFTLVLADHKSP
ncbi:putative transmembrane sensor protein [Komagataeibacter intermedius AF2]|uniref:Putative transmembrane sensor protein n=1 Tax=Komagataeibacter intermedius AF2 TaxID=1458464 RepID=A0A0N1N550_9PROT|nr:FecR family protein [Komagataeibacter intermedius]KPH86577.1 putative transmembrane sensor protein [Komagataeibacter intermedius AF2]